MGLPSVCPTCHSGLEFIYEHGVMAAAAVVCPRCGWKPDKEAAKTSTVKARLPMTPTPMERAMRQRETDAAVDDLLALRTELES